MELRHLRYFAAVAEELHFGHAAQVLHIVQPALSKQIAALERELGVQLFQRTKRRVSLTAAGEAFYLEVRAILHRAEKAVDTARLTASGQVGVLDIGFVGPSMWSILPSILREHRLRFPGVRFRLQEASSGIQVRLLREGGLDVGLLRPGAHDELLVFEVVWREPLVVGLPEDHPSAGAEEVNLAELAGETFILVPRRDSPGFYDQCLALCQSYGFSPLVIEEGNTPAAMYGMVAAGLGVTVAPRSVISMPWRGVVYRELDRTSPDYEIALAYRHGDSSPALDAFLETVRAVMRPRQRTRQDGKAVRSRSLELAGERSAH